MKQYFGIDIGGTAVKLGIVDETGRVLLKGEESVSFDGWQTPILTTVLKAAQAFLAAQSVPALTSISGPEPEVQRKPFGELRSRDSRMRTSTGIFAHCLSRYCANAALRKVRSIDSTGRM